MQRKIVAKIKIVDKNFTHGVCVTCKKKTKRKIYASKNYYEGDLPINEEFGFADLTKAAKKHEDELKSLVEQRRKCDIYCCNCKKVMYE